MDVFCYFSPAGPISALIYLQLAGQVGCRPWSERMQLHGQMSAIAQRW